MSSDWSFTRRPFWVFSHLFAATVVISFVFLGLWQLDRHRERSAVNEVVGARSAPPAAELADVIDQPADEVEYRLVEARGSFVDADLVRVANRTQGGVAGQHLVATFRLEDGTLVLVNRGFVPLDPSATVTAPPTGPVTVRGWVRASVPRGMFGAVDNGEGTVVPRLDVDAIAGRLGQPVAPLWLQLDTDATGPLTFPDPLDPPSTDPGPHLSYMAQWFIFAVLGVGFYGALLRRTARRRDGGSGADEEPVAVEEPASPEQPVV